MICYLTFFIEFDHIVYPELNSQHLKKEKQLLFYVVLNNGLHSVFIDSEMEIDVLKRLKTAHDYIS